MTSSITLSKKDKVITTLTKTLWKKAKARITQLGHTFHEHLNEDTLLNKDEAMHALIKIHFYRTVRQLC